MKLFRMVLLLYLGWIWKSWRIRTERNLFSSLLSSLRPHPRQSGQLVNWIFFFFSLPGVADRMVWKRVVVSSGCDFDRGELESRIRNLLMYVYFVFFFLSFFYFCKRFSREKVKKKKITNLSHGIYSNSRDIFIVIFSYILSWAKLLIIVPSWFYRNPGSERWYYF